MTPYPYQWGAILRDNVREFVRCFSSSVVAPGTAKRRNAPDARPQRPEHPLALLWDFLAEDGPKSPEQLARIHDAATGREAA